MTVELPAQFEALIARLMAEGAFANAEEVVAAGLRLLEAQSSDDADRGDDDLSADDESRLRDWARRRFERLDTEPAVELDIDAIKESARRRFLG